MFWRPFELRKEVTKDLFATMLMREADPSGSAV
jgi:hypothetical protein